MLTGEAPARVRGEMPATLRAMSVLRKLSPPRGCAGKHALAQYQEELEARLSSPRVFAGKYSSF